MLQPLGLFFEIGNLLFRLRRLVAEHRHKPLFARVRRGNGLLTLLHDLSSFGETLSAFGQGSITAAKLLPAGVEAGDGPRVPRREIRQHRHRFERITAIVQGQQESHITQPAQTVERAETFAEKLLLLRDAWRERSDLPFDVALLLLQIRFDAQGDLQLTSANIQIDGDFLELPFRGLRLRVDLFEPLTQVSDYRAASVVIWAVL